MKKIKSLIMVLLFLVTFCGCGESIESEINYEIDSNSDYGEFLGNTQSNIDSSNEKNESVSQNNNSGQSNSSSQKIAVYTYSHAALEGAVIIEANSKTGAVKYKRKCESCGNLDSTTVSTYIKNSNVNTSYYCNKCQNKQAVKIKVSRSVDWQ